MTILSSQWDGLSSYLIARIFPVDHDGNRQGDVEVRAPVTEALLEGTFQWQSSFEGAGTESKAPALSAMLQSGAIQPLMNVLSDSVLSKNSQAENNALSDSMNSTHAAMSEFRGRTGITKLNSTQIFSGMAPMKITGNLLFRAYSDPRNEVEAPYTQLMKWALPEELARDGVLTLIARRVQSGSATLKEYLKDLMPSQAPTMVGFQYKRRYFTPMVIESLNEPLSSPITQDGYYASMQVPITLSTLTALDQNDWISVSTRSQAL